MSNLTVAELALWLDWKDSIGSARPVVVPAAR
jgi:hypothetical protein